MHRFRIEWFSASLSEAFKFYILILADIQNIEKYMILISFQDFNSKLTKTMVRNL